MSEIYPQADAHLLSPSDDGTVEFTLGAMVPTLPFERRDDALIIKLYGQDGELQELPVQDTKDNEMLGVWLRRFDRYTGSGK